MATQLELGDISVDVEFKDIKNVHLSVYPPTGRVRISAPSRMSLDTVRVYAISKLGWIKQQQKKNLNIKSNRFKNKFTPLQHELQEKPKVPLQGKVQDGPVKVLIKVDTCKELTNF